MSRDGKLKKHNTKTYQPKVKILKKIKIHQLKVELQERIKNLEGEKAYSHFFGREYERE